MEYEKGKKIEELIYDINGKVGRYSGKKEENVEELHRFLNLLIAELESLIKIDY